MTSPQARTCTPERVATTSGPRKGESRFAWLLAAGLATATVASAQEQPNSSQGEPTVEVDPTAETSTMIASFLEGEPGESSYSVDLYVPWYNPNDDSLTWHDFARFAEPGYVTVSQESKAPADVEFVIPYEYAALFNSGAPVSEQDYDRMKNFMATEIRSQLAEQLYYITPWDAEDYRSWDGNSGELDGHSVESISVVGTTSPEASTPSSIEPGNVDKENISLGELRASDATGRLVEVLKHMGVDNIEDIQAVSAEEIQFSEAEFSQLVELADTVGYGGTTSEKVFSLIAAYNRNSLNDAEVVNTLDTIVASKRAVEVKITFKDPNKKTAIIPVPFALLALVPFLRRRRNREAVSTSAAPGREQADPSTSQPDYLRVAPSELEVTEQYVVNTEADLANNFDFYRGVLDTHITTAEPSVNRMTADIVELWQGHDNRLREGMGQEPENQFDNPHQVFYGYLHAVALRRVIVEARRAGNHTPPSQMWNDERVRNRIREDIQRHVDGVKRGRIVESQIANEESQS